MLHSHTPYLLRSVTMDLTSLTQLAPSTATNTDTSVQAVPITAPPVLGPDPTATGVPTHSDESATTEPGEAIICSLDGLTLTSPSPTTQAISLPTVNIHEKGATCNERDRRRPCRATQTSPRFDLLLPSEPCAIDAEFQRYRKVDGESESKCYTRPGRLSIVNTRGDVILDVYVRYGYVETERKVITHYDKRFLVERDDFLLRNGAVEAEIVEPWVQQIVANRIVVLHGGQQDLEMFKIVEDMWASSKTVDTQNLYSYLQRDGTPGLKTCAREIFGASIQEVEHSPVEDAAMTMRLYLGKVRLTVRRRSAPTMLPSPSSCTSTTTSRTPPMCLRIARPPSTSPMPSLVIPRRWRSRTWSSSR